MAMQIKESKLKESSLATKPEAWINEFGRLDMTLFELASKSYQGKIYRLTPEEAKIIAETVGFTARFDNANIRAAYMDIFNRAGSITTEITKNTKPTDIGLRYTADRWESSERAKTSDSLRPWLRAQYKAPVLPDKTSIALAELLKLKIEERELFYIRVNFKDLTYSLIAEKDNADKFPVKAFSIFSLGQDEVDFIDSSDPVEYKDDQSKGSDMTETNIEPIKPLPLPKKGPVETTSKYSTYSMSEIDQLLKQQSESIIGSLTTKINNQQKAMQENAKAQERNLSKVVDDLHAYGDSVCKRVETAESQQKDVLQKLVEQTKTGLVSEIEQFKTYVTKSVTPNIKVLDDRVKSMITEHMEKTKPEEKKMSTGMMLTILALTISVIDLVLVLFKHRLF